MTQPETITMTEQKEAAAFAKQHEAEQLLSMQIDDFKGEEIDPDNEPDLYLPLSAAKVLHEALSTQATALATARAEAEAKDAENLRLAWQAIEDAKQNAALREALKAAQEVIDFAAGRLWNCRPDAIAARPANIDAALRKVRAALSKGPTQ